MIDVILTVAFFGGCVAIIKKQLKITTKFNSTAHNTNIMLNDFIIEHGLTNIDIHPFDKKSKTILKKKLETNPGIEFIGVGEKKGYDFLHCIQKSGDVFPPHTHQNSTQFIYVLSGKIKVSYCDNYINCPLTEKHCPISSVTAKSCKCNKIKVLNKLDHICIQTNHAHTIEIIEDSEYIVISKPSLIGDDKNEI